MTVDQILAFGRVAERLVTCLIAGLSLAFGWNLFRVGALAEQSASVTAQGWRVDLKRVGPGVFFALFGAVVLTVGLRSSLALSTDTKAPSISAADLPEVKQDVASRAQYEASFDPAVSKEWVASLNTILQVAAPDKFQSSDKQAIQRSETDLTNLRNALVIARFGSQRFSEYQNNKAQFLYDPSALDPAEQKRLQEIADWMLATRTLE